MVMTIIIAGGILMVLALGYTALSGPSAGKAYKRRLELLRERHGDVVTASAQAQIRKLLAARQTKIDDALSSFIPKPALLRRRLEMTGKPITLQRYTMASAGLALVILAALKVQGAPLMLALLLGLFVGIGLPHLFITILIGKRVKSFTKEFPDAIDLMVRGLRSGLPITETLGIVSTEIPGPVGIEFRTVSDKMKIGRTMEAALQETADRLGTAEFQFFVITLAIQRETGGNLAETLSNLSDVLRKRSQMKLKIRAMSSESKASAMIVGSLPFVVFSMVWAINPTYMGGFFTDDRLMVAGLGGLVWMTIGVGIMAKMVSFEI